MEDAFAGSCPFDLPAKTKKLDDGTSRSAGESKSILSGVVISAFIPQSRAIWAT